ncbi:RHS repeat domain-containing protein [Sphingomonas elodea]|uniref:RHS repeat domain-containing protein n=1 Tax=Sphingomonas elodea TaxID=179878 RepID=UPI0011105FBD|nr:RHS repeat domain-containing protein [Sphingomonas elodea]
MNKISFVFSLICIFTSTSAIAQSSTIYTYDARGRLIKVVEDKNSRRSVVTSYELDKADNRTRVKVEGAAYKAVVLPLAGYTVIPLK